MVRLTPGVCFRKWRQMFWILKDNGFKKYWAKNVKRLLICDMENIQNKIIQSSCKLLLFSYYEGKSEVWLIKGFQNHQKSYLFLNVTIENRENTPKEIKNDNSKKMNIRKENSKHSNIHEQFKNHLFKNDFTHKPREIGRGELEKNSTFKKM